MCRVEFSKIGKRDVMFIREMRVVMEVANLLLESFGESPKTCVTNSSHPPANLKGKGNPDLP